MNMLQPRYLGANINGVGNSLLGWKTKQESLLPSMRDSHTIASFYLSALTQITL